MTTPLSPSANRAEAAVLFALRRTLILCLCAGSLTVGCFSKKPAGVTTGFAPAAQPGPKQVVITPDEILNGKVVMVNQGFRFVILSFPVGHLPMADQYLTLYRGGVKIGEVKVTGQQYDDNVVADLLTGDAEVGDSVRKP